MTVGIVAACGDSEQQLVLAADRMYTAQQASPIEFEHPGTKMTELSPWADDFHIMLAYSGTVSLATEYQTQLQSTVREIRSQQLDQDQSLTIRNLADLAQQQYNQLVQNRIQENALTPLGLELDDLQKQHKFKDEFFNKLWQDAESQRNYVYENLEIILGGVDDQGSHVYGIGAQGRQNLNDPGYGVTGSGHQPARSEFIREQYNRQCDLETALSVVTAAKMRAEDAQGVGEETDIAVIDRNGAHQLDDEDVSFLREREADIKDAQEKAKREILESRTLDSKGGE